MARSARRSDRRCARGAGIGDDPQMPEARISVRVQPRARADAIVELRDGMLIVRVMAPPLDGRANQAVCRLIAEILDLRPARLSIVRGQHARDKVVAVEGLDQADVDAAILNAVGGR